MAELLPCPFCGSRLLREFKTAPEHGDYAGILCHNCGAEGPTADLKAMAATLWNTRVFGAVEKPRGEEASSDQLASIHPLRPSDL